MQEKLEEEEKKGSLKLEGGNDILGQSLGRKPTPNHFQGVGKFVTPSMYYNTPWNYKERDRENMVIHDRFEMFEQQLEQLRKEIHMGQRHSDMGSCSFPKGIEVDDANDEDAKVMLIYVSSCLYCNIFSLMIFRLNTQIFFRVYIGRQSTRNSSCHLKEKECDFKKER